MKRNFREIYLYLEAPDSQVDRNKRGGLEKIATLFAHLLSKSINNKKDRIFHLLHEKLQTQ